MSLNNQGILMNGGGMQNKSDYIVSCLNVNSVFPKSRVDICRFVLKTKKTSYLHNMSILLFVLHLCFCYWIQIVAKYIFWH